VRPSIPKPLPRILKPAEPIRRSRIKNSRTRVGKRTSKRRKQRKAKCKDADRLFSLLIRTRDDWTCRACGKPNQAPQCAHIVSRRYRATRWLAVNAVCLCAGCHISYTYDPIAWEDWVEDHLPGRLTMLKCVARAGVSQVDYDDLCASLTQQLSEMQTRRGGEAV
jgi:hypothetical protein